MPAGRLLSTGQAARLLNVTPDTVVKWIRKGALPALRTAGGHYRVAPQDLEQYTETETRPGPGEGFVHCWEYYAVDGVVGAQCKECLVYRARALRCYEMSSLSRDAGYVGTYCKTSCDECPYYLQTVGQPRRVLVVTDSVKLRHQIESDPRGAGSICDSRAASTSAPRWSRASSRSTWFSTAPSRSGAATSCAGTSPVIPGSPG